jgi:hypothetical protein
MSMDQAPENNLPPHTDAAHHDPAAGTGLRLSGDAAREIAALRRQVAEAEDHNSELLGVLSAVRTWADGAERAAINRLAQGTPDPRYWQGQAEAAQAVGDLVKSVV